MGESSISGAEEWWHDNGEKLRGWAHSFKDCHGVESVHWLQKIEQGNSKGSFFAFIY